jgi:hemerythrin-like metal-binding protein
MNISPPILLNPDDFKIGFEIIDEHHAEIVECINELYMMRFNGCKTIRPIISKLRAHVNKHFKFEESLMQLCNYPGLEAHSEEHDKLYRASIEFIRKFNIGEDVSEDLQKFLFEMLIHHVNKVDRAAMNYCFLHGFVKKTK